MGVHGWEPDNVVAGIALCFARLRFEERKSPVPALTLIAIRLTAGRLGRGVGLGLPVVDCTLRNTRPLRFQQRHNARIDFH